VEDRSVTQLLILSFLLENKTSLKEIAQGMGMTRQAVSYHMRNLRRSGYTGDGNRITPEGVEFLYAGLSGLRDHISKTIGKLDNAQVWEAYADDDLNQGAKVYLRMKDGMLHASTSEKSDSRAVCMLDAGKGEITGVSSISGIIPLTPSQLTVILLPDIEKIKNFQSLLRDTARKMPGDQCYVCTVGELANYVAKSLLKQNFSSFGSMESAFDAAQRGVRSVILVTRRRFAYESLRLETLISGHPDVKMSVVEI
jgi:predicted transcriptional regulator